MSQYHHNYVQINDGDDILETNTIITYLACVAFLFIFGKIFAVPLAKIIKLILNSILGAVLIWLINLIGAGFNFHIGINMITAIFVGILGLPGAILLIVLKLLI